MEPEEDFAPKLEGAAASQDGKASKPWGRSGAKADKEQALEIDEVGQAKWKTSSSGSGSGSGAGAGMDEQEEHESGRQRGRGERNGGQQDRQQQQYQQSEWNRHQQHQQHGWPNQLGGQGFGAGYRSDRPRYW